MLSVLVVSAHGRLARSVAGALTPRFQARARTSAARSLALKVRPSVTLSERAELLAAVAPFDPAVEVTEDLSTEGLEVTDADAVLVLGAEQRFSEVSVRVRCGHPEQAERLRAELLRNGLSWEVQVQPRVPASELTFGGASAFLRQSLHWSLSRVGMQVVETSAWPEEDLDVWLDVADPELLQRPPRARYGVLLQADDAELAEPLAASLRDHGFAVRVVPMDGVVPERLCGENSRFRWVAGPFQEAPADRVALRTLLQAGLTHLDPARWVLEEQDGEAAAEVSCGPTTEPDVRFHPDMVARVQLPLGAHAAGSLLPYVGPAGHQLVLKTDRPERVAGLVQRLRELGLIRISVVEEPFLVAPFRFSEGSLAAVPDLADQVFERVREAAAALGVEPLGVERRRRHQLRALPATILFPTEDLEALPETLSGPEALADWKVRIHHHGADPEPLVSAVKRAGFKEVEARPSRDREFLILYGGATDQALRLVREACAGWVKGEPVLRQMWSEEDRDIFVFAKIEPLPASAPGPAIAPPDLATWVHGPGRADDRPFLAVGEQEARVGRFPLAVRPGPTHPLVPEASAFAHFHLDPHTAELLEHLARAVVLRQPCLLEGPTSVSKTSAVLFLALVLRRPVVRLNLNGQTETGELIGRYVPDERTAGGGWRWQDGAVVRALREGWWLLLDELNLAEPQVLERLNPVLEREPSLVLTEHLGERIGPAEVHPDFRVFGTMNPAGDAGRSALSPAWRNRWTATRLLEPPSEASLEQFLGGAVFGSAAPLEVGGLTWAPTPGRAGWASLAAAPGIGTYLRCLVRFFVALERALAAPDGLGRDRRDRYAVSRRDLLSVLDFLQLGGGTVSAQREALVRVFLDRFAVEDRAVVIGLLDAAGIGPSTWVVEGEPSAAGAVP